MDELEARLRQIQQQVHDTASLLGMRLPSPATLATEQPQPEAVPTLDGLRIGTDITTDKPVILSDSNRNSGVYIVGKKGMGKSDLLLNLILHDIDIGHGLAVLDPHGDLIDYAIQRLPANKLDQIIYWDMGDTAYPFGLNPYACNRLEDDDATADTILDMFAKLWNTSRADAARLQLYIRNSALVLLANPGSTMLDLRNLLKDEQVARRLLAAVTHQPLLDFWNDYYHKSERARDTVVDPLFTRISTFVDPKILYYMLGQGKSSIDFRKLMDERKILFVRLPEAQLGKQNLQLLGAIVIGQILMAALSRHDIPFDARAPFHLYVDEFDLFETPDFATIISKARKYNLHTITAHQYLSQLSEDNRVAVKQNGVVISFGVVPDDAREIAGLFEPLEITEQTGTEPVRVPHPDVVRYLVAHQTHPDPTVTSFIRLHLTPLVADADVKLHPPHGRNIRAFGQMDDTYQINKDLKPRAELLLQTLTKYFEKCMQEPTEKRYPNLSVAWFSANYFGRDILTPIFKEIGNYEVLSQVGVKSLDSKLQAEIERRIELSAPKPYVYDSQHGPDIGMFNAIASQRELLRWKGKDGEIAQFRLWMEFIGALYQVADILAAEPITVPTDRVQPKIVTRQTSRQELGVILSRQEQRQALCRIQGVGQYQMQLVNTYVERPPADSRTVELARAYLVEQARRRYGKSREKVAEEIRQRSQIGRTAAPQEIAEAPPRQPKPRTATQDDMQEQSALAPAPTDESPPKPAPRPRRTFRGSKVVESK